MSRWNIWVFVGLVVLLESPAMAQDVSSVSRKVTPPQEVGGGAVPGRETGPASSSATGLLAMGVLVTGGLWYWKEKRGGWGRGDQGPLRVVLRRPLDTRHSLMLVELSGRLLLLSVSPTQVNLLKELDDPDEVGALTGPPVSTHSLSGVMSGGASVAIPAGRRAA